MSGLRVIEEIVNVGADIAPVVRTIGAQDPELRDQLRRAWSRVVSGAGEAQGPRSRRSRDRFDLACREAKEARVQLQYAKACGYAKVSDMLLRRVDGVCAVLYTLAHKTQ
jgi:four helix bundle protein